MHTVLNGPFPDLQERHIASVMIHELGWGSWMGFAPYIDRRYKISVFCFFKDLESKLANFRGNLLANAIEKGMGTYEDLHELLGLGPHIDQAERAFYSVLWSIGQRAVEFDLLNLQPLEGCDPQERGRLIHTSKYTLTSRGDILADYLHVHPELLQSRG